MINRKAMLGILTALVTSESLVKGADLDGCNPYNLQSRLTKGVCTIRCPTSNQYYDKKCLRFNR